MRNSKKHYVIAAALLLLTLAITSASQMTAPKQSMPAKAGDWDFMSRKVNTDREKRMILSKA